MQKCPSKLFDGVGFAMCGIECMLAATVLPLYVIQIGRRFHVHLPPAALSIIAVSAAVNGSESA